MTLSPKDFKVFLFYILQRRENKVKIKEIRK